MALDLLAEGWGVFGLDLTTETQGDVILEHLVSIRCDVSDEDSVTSAFERVSRVVPAINALICCAGVLRAGPVAETSPADFDLLFAVNTRGPWLCTRVARPLLCSAAQQGAPARIVMMASIAATRPKVNGGVYAATKAALVQLTRVLGVELAPEGIRVNALGPGTVDTPMIRPALYATEGYRASGPAPVGRIAQPADISAAVKLLLSGEAEFITGTFLPVDGGTSAAFES
nr:SDR family oxidoreductase [Halomonas socia]